MLRTFLTILLAAALTGSCPAAPPTVESVAPGVGQRGTEFTLMLTGARLTDPKELLFYTPGMACMKLTAASENQVTATLKAAADCGLGDHPFRLRTAGGASEVRIVRVTPFPVIAEQEPNDSPKEAQPVPLNVSIAGTIEAAGVDCYAVKLRKGERLAAEVEGVRLGGELTDTFLTIFGPDGRELASVDDTPLFHQDPFQTIVVPTDGVYTVQVRESSHGGGDGARYVLHVGNFVRPAAVFPAGGPAGSEVEIKLLGDAAGERTQKVKLPAAGERFELYPTDGGVPAPTLNPFRVSPFPNVIESEPNDDPTHATASPQGWPVAFNGIIGHPGDVDHFRFRAARGDVLDVSAFAYRVGSPLDSVVAVLAGDGSVVAANDDDETHDSRVRVVIPADGEYFVRVTDKRNQGGPSFIYRIEVDRPEPALTVFLAAPVRKTQDRNVIAIPRGNRVMAYLGVRRDGFEGPVAIAAGELPNGVRAKIGAVPANEYLVPVIFEAAADAPLGSRLVDLSGTATPGDGTLVGGFRQDVTLIHGPGDTAVRAVTQSQLAVVVVDEGPLAVSLVPPTGPRPVDGTFDVKVMVTRGADFVEPVEVSFPCLPPGVEAPTSVVIPADKSDAVVTMIAHPTAEVGAWRLAAEAKPASPARARRDPLAGGGAAMKMGGGRRPRRSAVGAIPVATQLVPFTLSEAFVKGQFLPVAGEQGKSAKIVCSIESVGPLPGSFTARLDGLPPRVTATPVTLQADAKQAEFTVAVDATTPTGPHPSLVCELVGEIGGQKVVYRIGRGGVFTVNSPGSVKTDASGKPLSPLEALRQNQKTPDKDGPKQP